MKPLNPFLLMAPLEGMTDSIYRRCYYRFFPGIDKAVTPFLPIPDKVARVPLRVFRDVALPGKSPVPEIPQLLVSRKEAFLTAGRALADAGYREVNWNLGCPSKGVVNKGKGAGMLARTDEILSILDEVLRALPLEISLKIRIGMDNPVQSRELVTRLKGYPVKEIVCHPRLGIDMYRGTPDLESFTFLADLTDIPLIYNGDLYSVDDYIRLKKMLPITAGWMIGRGLLKDPFLPEQIRNWEQEGRFTHSDPMKEPRFREFLEVLFREYGKKIPRESNRVSWLKGFLAFILTGIPDEEMFRKRLNPVNSEIEYIRFLDEIFKL